MRPEAIVAAWVAVAIVAPTQQMAAQDVFVTLVHTHFNVTNSQGRPVTNLGPADFTVYDDDAPQQIAEFGRRVDAALNVALLVDRSRSVSDRFQFLRFAAGSSASRLLTHPGDHGLLVAFDAKVYLLQGWTSDPTALRKEIDTLTAAGGSSVFDAVFKTCRDEFAPDAARQNAVVLVTDGEDTTSAASVNQALEMAVLSRAAVYVIGVPAEPGSLNPRELQGRAVLSQLADLTGGGLFYPDEAATASLDRLFARIEDELRNGYTLSFYLSGAPDNTLHHLRIEPRDRSLTVHAPRGYYLRAPGQL